MSLRVVNFSTGGAQVSLTTIPAGSIATTTGNLLVVGFRQSAADMSAVLSISDTSLDDFIAISGSLATSGITQVSQLWYAQNITGNASNVVQANLNSGSTFTGICVWEIAGADPVNTLDAVATGNSPTTVTNITSSSYSTVNANEIVCAIASYAALSETFTQQSDYTLDSAGFPTGSYVGAEHIIFNSTQNSITTSMAGSTLATAVISVASFNQVSPLGVVVMSGNYQIKM